MLKFIVALVATILAALCCNFVAGNFDFMSWKPEERLIYVIVCVFTFGSTLTFPVESIIKGSDK